MASALAAVVITQDVSAQAINLIGGARFKVVAPASLQGARRFTFAAGATSGAWGGDLSTPIINAQLIQAIGTANGNTDSLLCSPAANGTGSIPALTGKVAILYRGDCSFSSKAFEAEAGGAVAVVIINNIPGEPAGMAATAGINVTIPVFMISDVDGAALMNAIRNGVDTRVTFTKWGSGEANDIAVISNFNATYHGGAIPRKQLATSNGNPRQYRMYTGDIAVNFGTDSAKDMVLTREVWWQPNGGAATMLNTDTAHLPFLAPIDSIDIIANKRFYNPHATSNGKFILRNSLSSPFPDIDTVDNINKYVVQVTDSIYSKSTWDTVNNRPAYTGAYRLNSGNPFTWGPLFYTAVGGDYPAKLQFTLATNANESLIGESVTTTVFKFNDGANGNPVDGVFQDGELALAALGYKAFGPADTASFTHHIVSYDPSQLSSPMEPLAGNSTYWYGISPSAGFIFMGANSDENPFIRTFNSQQADSVEYYAPQFLGAATVIPGGGVSNSDFRMIPFVSTNNIDSASVDQTSGIPSIALHVSATNPMSVGKTPVSVIRNFEVFPNPSQGAVNVRWSATENFGLATVTVFNGVGQAVTNFKTRDLQGEQQISLGHLASGTYWVVFASEKGVDTKQIKIVK